MNLFSDHILLCATPSDNTNVSAFSEYLNFTSPNIGFRNYFINCHFFFTVGNRSSRRSIGGLSLSPMSMSMTGPPSASIPVTAGNQGKVQQRLKSGSFGYVSGRLAL